MAILLYNNDMNWKNKLYTVILEKKGEDRHAAISKNVAKIKTMPDGPERDALKASTLKLISGGRESGQGAIETAPKPKSQTKLS